MKRGVWCHKQQWMHRGEDIAYADFDGTTAHRQNAPLKSWQPRCPQRPVLSGELRGGRVVELGNPPADAGEDWLIVVKKQAF